MEGRGSPADLRTMEADELEEYMAEDYVDVRSDQKRRNHISYIRSIQKQGNKHYQDYREERRKGRSITQNFKYNSAEKLEKRRKIKRSGVVQCFTHKQSNASWYSCGDEWHLYEGSWLETSAGAAASARTSSSGDVPTDEMT